MTDLHYREQRGISSKIHFSDPTSKREWIVWRTRDRDEALTFLAGYSIPPAVDFVLGIPRYFRDADMSEIGNGVWRLTGNYAKDPNTISMEVNYTGGTKKMVESLELVRSYSCASLTSSTTQAAIADLGTAQTAVDLAADSLDTSVPDANTAAATAQAFANDPAVDPVVFSLCVSAINQTRITATQGLSVTQLVQLLLTTIANATNAANLGNAAALAAVTTAQTTITAIVSNIGDNETAATTAANSAQSDAANAVVAASTENIESQSAATQAVGAADAATQVVTDIGLVTAVLSDVTTAMTALVAAMTADQASGIPNIGRMINVNEKGVDGVEVEDKKCDITLTKHFQASLLPTTYWDTLEEMSPSVNNAIFYLNFKGQIRGYAKGELKFKNFTFKQGGDDSLEITFYFSSSRNATEFSNVTVGNSSPIVKDGWHYLSVLFTDEIDETAFVKVKKPKAAYVHRTYDEKDFTRLLL